MMSSTIDHYKQSLRTLLNRTKWKFEYLLCDNKLVYPITSVLWLNDREIIVENIFDRTLKKYVLDESITKLTWSFTKDITHYVEPSVYPGQLRKLSSTSFIYFQTGNGNVLICCTDTGQTLSEIVLTLGKIVRNVKQSNEFIILLFRDTTEKTFDFDIYSKKEKKLIDKNIVYKHYEFHVKCEIYYEILEGSYLVTYFGVDRHKKSYLTLWKLNTPHSEEKQICTQMSTHVKELYAEDYAEMIESTDNCFIIVFSIAIELYKFIDNDLVLMKVIRRIFKSSQLVTLSIIPTSEYNMIMVQNLIQRRPEKNVIYITFHNFLNNKSFQILEYEMCSEMKLFDFYDEHFNQLLFLKNSTNVLVVNSICCKLELDDKSLAIIYHDIRKYARVLAQAHRTNTGLFNRLPLEIVILIICFTRNSYNTDFSLRKKIAMKYFCKP